VWLTSGDKIITMSFCVMPALPLSTMTTVT
jgi:hypothetical protein